MSQYTFFKRTLTSDQAFRVWLTKLESANDGVDKVLQHPTASYLMTMKICAADRMLTMEFYDAWRADKSLQAEAPRIRSAVANAYVQLQKVQATGLIVDKGENMRGTHLREMIENTQSRIAILDVLLDLNMDRNTKCAEVERLYRDFGDIARKRAA